MKDYNLKKILEWPFRGQVSFLLASMAILLVGFTVYESLQFNKTKNFYMASNQQIFLDYKNNLEKIRQQKILLNSIAMINKELDKFSSNISSEVQLVSVQNKIMKFGETRDIVFSSFDTGIKESLDDLSFITITIGMSGTYDQIASFMSAVANMKELIEIPEFVFTQKTVVDNAPIESIIKGEVVNCHLLLKVYQKSL